ncbi:MAG: hypothetical protein ACLFSE_13930 [Spirochaetia bacterium]
MREIKTLFLLLIPVLIVISGCATGRINQLEEQNRTLLTEKEVLTERIKDLTDQLEALESKYKQALQTGNELEKTNKNLLVKQGELAAELRETQDKLNRLMELTAMLAVPEKPKLTGDSPVPVRTPKSEISPSAPPRTAAALTEVQLYIDPRKITALPDISTLEEDTAVLKDRELNVLWYIEPRIPEMDAAFYVYFGRTGTGKLTLRMVLKTPFPERVRRNEKTAVTVTTDTGKYSIPASLGITTRIQEQAIWYEYADFPVNSLTFEVLKDVISSRICVVEVITESGYSHIRQLTESERSALHTILYTYRSLGGAFPQSQE